MPLKKQRNQTDFISDDDIRYAKRASSWLQKRKSLDNVRTFQYSLKFKKRID